MRKLPFFLIFSFVAVCFSSCKQGDLSKQIAAMEQSYAKTHNKATADSLLLLYREAVKKHPEDHANNFRYLIKGADLEFFVVEDGPAAVHWADEALKNHGDKQNLTDAMGLFARIWSARDYHRQPATRFKPDEIDLVKAYLLKNQPWIDSSLLRLDKEMTNSSGVVADKSKAEAFIETAEGYASLIKDQNPDKHADLIMKAAGVAKSMGNPNKAIQLYFQIAEKMPEHPKAPTALFMMGFTYDDDLHDFEKAKAVYEDFLKRYPDDPDYADDAEMSLKLLGKSPEEVIQLIEKKNANKPSK